MYVGVCVCVCVEWGGVCVGGGGGVACMNVFACMRLESLSGQDFALYK